MTRSAATFRLAATTLAAAMAFTQTPSEEKAKSTGAVVVRAAEVPWKDAGARKTAGLWRAEDNSSREGFERWPEGFGEKELTTHPFDFSLVVLEGIAGVAVEGGRPKELGPGAYVFVPARVKHMISCKSATECVMFVVFRTTRQ